MPPDARKAFMNIMTSLIEKSPDPKLLKTLTKIVDEWIRLKVRERGRNGRMEGGRVWRGGKERERERESERE